MCRSPSRASHGVTLLQTRKSEFEHIKRKCPLSHVRGGLDVSEALHPIVMSAEFINESIKDRGEGVPKDDLMPDYRPGPPDGEQSMKPGTEEGC